MVDERLDWIDADGVTHALDGSEGVLVLVGRTGLFMPPMALIEDDRPSGDGSIIRTVQRKSRDIELPIIVQTPSYDETMDLIASLAGWFDPTRGDGTLRMTRASGRQRELLARYREGLEGSDELNAMVETWARAVLVIRAATLWQDASDTVVDMVIGSNIPTFFPILPLRLTASTVLANIGISNLGDAEAYPVWTITGPGDSIVLENVTTGKKIALDLVLSASEVLTIDTRPGPLRDGLAIRDQDGSSRFSALTGDSSLWTLPRGTSQLSVQMAGATGSSQISLRYRARWIGP